MDLQRCLYMVWSSCIAASESKAAKTQFQHLSPHAPTTAQAGTNRREFHAITAGLSTIQKHVTIWQLFSVSLTMVWLLWKMRISDNCCRSCKWSVAQCIILISAYQHTPRNVRKVFTSILKYMNEDLALKHPSRPKKPSICKLLDSWFGIRMNSYQFPCKLGNEVTADEINFI